MFYGFGSVWVFLRKTERAKASQPMQRKIEKREAYTLFP
jgi:hypothetical protein